MMGKGRQAGWQFLIAVLVGAASAPVSLLGAQTNDSAAVVSVAQELLRAISTKDTAAARRVMLPGAIVMSVVTPATPGAAPSLRSDVDFYRSLTSGPQRFLERMWTPTVILHGALAEVHAPYDFHVDGKFSHCGTDVFTIVRAKGEWLVSAIVYTVQRTGCAPSPLGAPAP
jgi:hypothetical protein